MEFVALQPYKFVIVHRKGVNNCSLPEFGQERGGRSVRDLARYNRPRQPYTCLPGNFVLNLFMIWMMQYSSRTVLEYSYNLSINRAVFCSCIAFSILLVISPALYYFDCY